jgi:hypothetical protein
VVSGCIAPSVETLVLGAALTPRGDCADEEALRDHSSGALSPRFSRAAPAPEPELAADGSDEPAAKAASAPQHRTLLDPGMVRAELERAQQKVRAGSPKGGENSPPRHTSEPSSPASGEARVGQAGALSPAAQVETRRAMAALG